MNALFGLASCLLVVYCEALFGPNSPVVELTPTNFQAKVTDSNHVWIVKFYAPWCGHCRNFAPEFTKAATALKGVVRLGAVDCDKYKEMGGMHQVQGFPTVKIFVPHKAPQLYQGPRTARGVVDASFDALRQKVYSSLEGSSRRSTDDDDTTDSKSDDGGKSVIELTDSNFEKTVLQSEDMWLVEFYAPWCGHCKNLAPHWASAASELKGKVKLGALDATVHTVMAGRYGIRGFPTIKFFPSGKKSDMAEEYDGGRTSGDIVHWALDKLAENIPAPKITQITSMDALKDGCEEHQLCIIAVLPHILDCQSQCRNDYIQVLNKLGEKYKKNRWGWLWTEGGTQMELEEAFGIGGFGYPALAAANVRKMKYSLLRGSFSYDGINEFLRELAVGRGSTAPLRGAALPKVSQIDPWDGKDGKLDFEEEDMMDVEIDGFPKTEL